MADYTREFAKRLQGRLKEKPRFLNVIAGARQVGKSTGIKAVVATYKGPAYYVTAEQLTPPNAQWLAEQWLRARSLGRECLFVVDAVQKVEGS